MNIQPELENELVTLRPLSQADFDELYQVAKDPLIWQQHPDSERYKLDVFTEFFNDSINSEGALIVMDTSTNQIIGSSRYKPINDADNAIEIGWSFLARSKWGGMYNKAIKELMISHALKYVEHIIFYIGKQNTRSQKAVEKIGGKLINRPELFHLKSNDENNVTYRISRKG